MCAVLDVPLVALTALSHFGALLMPEQEEQSNDRDWNAE